MLISIVEDIKEMMNLQYAHMLVCTSSVNPMNKFMKVRINGIISDVRVAEEIVGWS